MKERKPAINKIPPRHCAGCFGCYNSCPHDAIKMELDKNGFYIPIILVGKCKNCGICQEHCPVLKKIDSKNKFKDPLFYAGKSTNRKIRMMSSSGGIFPEIAKYVLKNNGVVFGVSWNNNLKLKHIKIKNFDGIIKIIGSKYIQSNVGNTYKEVLKEIHRDKNVLFVGTPCQIAALKTFTNSDNLLTIDLVCHGVPSYILFEKYLEYMERKKEQKIEQISFRDKKKGWNDFQTKIVFKDNSVYQKNHNFDPFFIAYLKNICLRNSCYKCDFNRIPRPGDITLGDFWGNPPEDKKTNEGVSVILANNEKGDGVLKHLERTGRIEIKKTDFDTATENNLRIYGGEFQVPRERNNILYDLNTQDFEYINEKYIEIPSPIKFQLNKYLQKLIKLYRSK